MSLPEQFAAANQTAILIAGVERTQLEFTGSDRAKFLHNLCTNNVRDLPIGSGCETFILNVKGHTIGHGYIYAGETSHVFDTVAGQGEFLAAHFDRYLIREDVQIVDRTAEWETLLVVGPQDSDVLSRLNEILRPDQIRRVAWFAVEAYQLVIPRAERDKIIQSLLPETRTAGPELFESLRIEHGTPLFGNDISADNLPQEIDRDRQAISFTKGCYLGQETVARIDALGHVNRILRRIKFRSDLLPVVGAALQLGEKNVGQLTSVCWSPGYKDPLTLGFVKRGYDAPGTALSCGKLIGIVMDESW